MKKENYILITKDFKRNTLFQKILMHLYNTPLGKLALVKKLFYKSYKLPSSTVIGPKFKCSSPLLQVEDNVILGYGLFVIAYAPIKIGAGSMFSFNNTIITSTHDYQDFNTVKAFPVVIGKNVWITSNVTILPGVHIGDNSIIGAGSVVTKDIPSNVFAAGNPARVIKSIMH